MTGWVAWATTTIGVLGGLGGIAALLLVPGQRRKAKADAAAVIVDSAVELLAPLQANAERLQARTERLERELLKVERIVRLIKRELELPSPSVRRLREIVGIEEEEVKP